MIKKCTVCNHEFTSKELNDSFYAFNSEHCIVCSECHTKQTITWSSKVLFIILLFSPVLLFIYMSMNLTIAFTIYAFYLILLLVASQYILRLKKIK